MISVEPAGGGPRPLPGTAAGSVGSSVALVSAVALLGACGAIKSSVVVPTGPEPGPAVPLADAPLSAATTAGSEDVPATSVGQSEPVGEIEEVPGCAGVETPLTASESALPAAAPAAAPADCSTVTVEVDVLPLSPVEPASAIAISVPGSVTAEPELVSVAVDSAVVEVELMFAPVVAAALESLPSVLEIESSVVCVEPAEEDGRSAACAAGAAVGAGLFAAAGSALSDDVGAVVDEALSVESDAGVEETLALELSVGELLTDEVVASALAAGAPIVWSELAAGARSAVDEDAVAGAGAAELDAAGGGEASVVDTSAAAGAVESAAGAGAAALAGAWATTGAGAAAGAGAASWAGAAGAAAGVAASADFAAEAALPGDDAGVAEFALLDRWP